MNPLPGSAPRHRLAVLSCIAAATCAVALAPPAQSAKRTCDRLSGKKVLKTKSIKIVGKPFNRIYRKGNTRQVGRDFLACALPRGTVRRVGQLYREYPYPGSVNGRSPIASGFTTVGQSAGTFVIVRFREADLAGNFSERTYKVVNVITGKSYRYFHALKSDESEAEPGPPVAVKLDDQGRLAEIITNPEDAYSAPAKGQAQVVGFNSAGKRQVFDTALEADIPKASLTLTDGVVGWTNAGQPKTAAIAGP